MEAIPIRNLNTHTHKHIHANIHIFKCGLCTHGGGGDAIATCFGANMKRLTPPSLPAIDFIWNVIQLIKILNGYYLYWSTFVFI